VKPLWTIVWRFLKKSKIELPYDPAIPLLGICPKEMKTGFQRDISTPVVIEALLTGKIWKQPKCLSVDEWIELWYIYKRILFRMRKKEILVFATTWMDFESIVLSEISQTEEDEHCMVSLICRTKKKKKSQTHDNRVEAWWPETGGWKK